MDDPLVQINIWRTLLAPVWTPPPPPSPSSFFLFVCFYCCIYLTAEIGWGNFGIDQFHRLAPHYLPSFRLRCAVGVYKESVCLFLFLLHVDQVHQHRLMGWGTGWWSSKVGLEITTSSKLHSTNVEPGWCCVSSGLSQCCNWRIRASTQFGTFLKLTLTGPRPAVRQYSEPKANRGTHNHKKKNVEMSHKFSQELVSLGHNI